jgi:hypothetical protein
MAFCGPQAAARITGWPLERVLTHLRALREIQGRPQGRLTGWYTSIGEIKDVLRRAGWHVGPREDTTLASVGLDHRDHWYLCHHPRHVFAFKRRVDRGTSYYLRHARRRVLAWRISRWPIVTPPVL